MLVRKATPEDSLGIAKVQVDTWKSTYQGIVPDKYLDSMTLKSRDEKWKAILNKGTVYVAEEKGTIVGFSSGGSERTGNYPEFQGELYAIYILKDYQRKGLGKLLLQPVVNDLIQKNILSMIVVVLEDNPSRYFYESLGASLLDTVQAEIGGKQLLERVYGWKDIRKIPL
ncbi:N-acetyltransferase family protein [Bacillus sp. SCS-153A]|uniref:GNAT family N-acetyltransferase n=1 Tax=Rossellomorea sedimentorum TaxID=3115294 RepID=UPI0039064737